MKVCLQYGYEVELTGVGQAPPGQRERVGFCSQIGVFHRLGGKERYNMFDEDAEDVFSYTLVSKRLYTPVIFEAEIQSSKKQPVAI